jgi:hypothetical protein
MESVILLLFISLVSSTPEQNFFDKVTLKDIPQDVDCGFRNLALEYGQVPLTKFLL